MNFAERYEVVDGQVLRFVETAGCTVESRIRDVSGLGKKAPAWSRFWRSFLRGARPTLGAPNGISLGIADLFCGCGGLGLGVRQAAAALGIDTRVRVAVDIDEEALAVYQLNHQPDVTICDDVSRLVSFQLRGSGREAEFAYTPELVDARLREAGAAGIDIVIAGPPCEGHSNLNNRTRRDDPRNLLLVEAVATAVALQPKVIIIENVPDVIRDTLDVVDTARGLLEKSGYHLDGGTLSAVHFGLPQTRKRFFLLASKGPILSVAEVEAALGGRAETDVRWAIEDLLDAKSDPAMDATVEQSAATQTRIDWLFEHDQYDLPNNLRPDCHKDGHTYGSVYGRLRWDEPAGTITTGFVTMGRGRFVHPLRRRTLTPREAARLQGFPDFYHFKRSADDLPPKKGLVKWIGDAVPPVLGYAASMAVLAPLRSSVVPTRAVPKSATRARMQAVRRTSTAPETLMREALKIAGVPFETNKRGLPGTPDIVFRKHQVAVFVHGCFWHHHFRCPRATIPKTNPEFWLKKFATNKARDQRAMSSLRKAGWHPMVVWECDLEKEPTIELDRVRVALARAASDGGLGLGERIKVARVAH